MTATSSAYEQIVYYENAAFQIKVMINATRYQNGIVYIRLYNWTEIQSDMFPGANHGII